MLLQQQITSNARSRYTTVHLNTRFSILYIIGCKPMTNKAYTRNKAKLEYQKYNANQSASYRNMIVLADRLSLAWWWRHLSESNTHTSLWSWSVGAIVRHWPAEHPLGGVQLRPVEKQTFYDCYESSAGLVTSKSNALQLLVTFTKK